MEFYILLMILVVVGSIVVPVLVFYFIIKGIHRVTNNVEAYEREQGELNRLVDQARQLQGTEFPSELNYEVWTKLAKMKSLMGQMNNLQKQKYEANMGSMMNSVIGAGFTNFNPSDYA